MNKTYKILEFHKIIDQLKEYAYTRKAKQQIDELAPILDEQKLKKRLQETDQARQILDQFGMPPLVSLENMDEIMICAEQGGCLMPEQLEKVRDTLTAVMRVKDFLCRCKQLTISLPYYEEQMNDLPDIKEEIVRKIRGGVIDDHASKQLKDIRQEIARLDAKMRSKADSVLKSSKEYCSDSFITIRSGRLCLPVKKEYRSRIQGSVIDTSASGATVFMEPAAVREMNDEITYLRLSEENEEKRILYELTAMVADHSAVFYENIRIMEKLDYIFAKGKLSFDMQGICPQITTRREIRIKAARHPFIDPAVCVPLDFAMAGETRGIVITGPNTGGKTVAIKTVGLLSMMAQCGLHVPCEEGVFAMHNQILCDIGDGQDITENLSTFSAHITNILEILQNATEESLIILDELGSGTDPTEGMGIAIAILEELRRIKCLFLATTHYPEVKTYALNASDVINARMEFDRQSLRPCYRLEIGRAGESCALYIAKRLGMPPAMLRNAAQAAYGEAYQFPFDEEEEAAGKVSEARYAPRIQKEKARTLPKEALPEYQIGDSVMLYPDKKIGIVCRPVNEKGVLQVQCRDKKIWINQKRVKLHVRADKLYPENYDFSIVFEDVATRKAKHQMDRKYCKDLVIDLEE